MAKGTKASDRKCVNADYYKGLVRPTCNGGKPCDTCMATYVYEQIKHGDDEHRQWLRNKANEIFGVV